MPFTAAEVGNKLSRELYEEIEPGLRLDLLNAQYDLKDAAWSVVVLLMGDDARGCEETVDLLHEWMDARHLDTFVFEPPDESERERPEFWRYWRRLPARGRCGLFVGDWQGPLLNARTEGRFTPGEFAEHCEELRRFEAMLAADGTLFLKFWLHLPRKEHEKRFKKAKKASRGDGGPTKRDRWVHEHYDDLMAAAADFLRETGNWCVVESSDREYRNATVATAMRAALEARIARRAEPPAAVELAPFAGTPPLDRLDLSQQLERGEYKARVAAAQQRLRKLAFKAEKKGVSTVLVFEGVDAAGKGGAIRRITQALPARLYRVVPIAAPSDEELAHHYLWRFWQRLPNAGRMVIFDRSWYGRVLVERVEGFAEEAEWQRAYAEINDFEAQLTRHGAFAKFWLQIDDDEQLRRFEVREKTAYKKYKITDDDYRNRTKRDQYELAVNEMIARTDTGSAPWQLVSANDKRWARVVVLESIVEALATRL